MKNSEDLEQAALFEWAAWNTLVHPELDLMFHIPNGGKRHIGTAIKLKKQGTKAGVPDIFLPVARCGFHGLFIELKANKNTATQLQKEWLAVLNDNGYCATVCRGWKEASNYILKYLTGGIVNEDRET